LSEIGYSRVREVLRSFHIDSRHRRDPALRGKTWTKNRTYLGHLLYERVVDSVVDVLASEAELGMKKGSQREQNLQSDRHFAGDLDTSEPSNPFRGGPLAIHPLRLHLEYGGGWIASAHWVLPMERLRSFGRRSAQSHLSGVLRVALG
jgi:hypothetical protein